MLIKTYNYKEVNGFIVQRDVFFKKHFVYLPLINYTGISVNDSDYLINAIGEKNYQIRYLDFTTGNFKENDPVTLRIILSDKTEDDIWDGFSTKCRNQVRKAQKSNLKIDISSNKESIDKFYSLYCKTMKYHGSPALPKRLFQNLKQEFKFNVVSAIKGTQIFASLILLFDDNIAWVPWAASERSKLNLCPNHLIYWEAIKLSLEKSISIFDFGRSPFGGATFHFKEQWGAYPTRIQIVQNNNQDLDIYGKYKTLSYIWTKMPSPLVNILGPYLTKYLVEL